MLREDRDEQTHRAREGRTACTPPGLQTKQENGEDIVWGWEEAALEITGQGAPHVGAATDEPLTFAQSSAPHVPCPRAERGAGSEAR